MLEEFFKSRTGVIIISVIWGLGLAALFRKSGEGDNSKVIEYQGPPPEELRQAYYRYGNNDTCYQYFPVITSCHK